MWIKYSEVEFLDDMSVLFLNFEEFLHCFSTVAPLIYIPTNSA